MNEMPITMFDRTWLVNYPYLTDSKMALFRPEYKDRLRRKAKFLGLYTS